MGEGEETRGRRDGREQKEEPPAEIRTWGQVCALRRGQETVWKYQAGLVSPLTPKGITCMGWE